MEKVLKILGIASVIAAVIILFLNLIMQKRPNETEGG